MRKALTAPHEHFPRGGVSALCTGGWSWGGPGVKWVSKMLCIPGSPHPTTNHWKSQHPFHGRLTSNMVCKHCEHQVSDRPSRHSGGRFGQCAGRGLHWAAVVWAGRCWEDSSAVTCRCAQAASAPEAAQLLRRQTAGPRSLSALGGTADLRSDRDFALQLRVLPFFMEKS